MSLTDGKPNKRLLDEFIDNLTPQSGIKVSNFTPSLSADANLDSTTCGQ